MTRKIKSVLIVGGGSSGWMTASAFARNFPDVKLTLIESPNVPIIGVGESTIGHINQFLHYIGLKDEDWMPHCNATYKTSIKFIDFRENPAEKPHTFHYPFGIMDVTDKPRGPMDWFIIKSRHPELIGDNKNFAEFYHSSILMTDANKMTRNLDGEVRGFRFDMDTAYHMDATAFGIFLRDKVCLPSGMTHILDDVTGTRKNADGDLECVLTKNNGELSADLFIDCTGFKSLLLEQTMNVPFISFHDTLQNDRAIATVIPYIDKEREMENYTSCTAIESGWVWNIPLWHRIGTGYVYSSKFATEAEAEEQFRRHLKSNRMVCPDDARADAAQFRHIKIKHGVHERAWERNVVGIGLANGFIEPLESTGLMLTHEAIMKMCAALEMRNGNITKLDIDMFNHAFREQIIGFKDFISQHYALSMRDDTPYWKAVSSKTYSKEMVDFVPSLYNGYIDIAHRIHRGHAFNHDMSGIIYIAAGMGYSPVNSKFADFMDAKYYETPGYELDVWNKWQEFKQRQMQIIDGLPTHYQFLKENIHKN